MRSDDSLSFRSRPRLIFYHLPRTAGVALIYDILFPNFFWLRRCYVNFDDKMQPLNRAHNPLAWSSWRRKQVRLLAGHMPFNFARQFPGPSEYFTFIRDPIARAVSDYYFCRRDPANPAFEAANRLSLAEFVAGDHSFVSNGYARWLSDAAFGARFGSDEEMLRQAIENLAQIAFIGITEQFDLSVSRLCKRYRLREYAARERHRNAFTPEDHELSKEELRLLRDRNTLDLAIYEQCLSRFSAENSQPALHSTHPSRL